MLPNNSAVSAAFLPQRPSVTSLMQYSARKARGLPGCPVCPPEPRARFLTCAPLVHSGPIRAYILTHKDAIQLWRTVMGPTRVFRACHMAPDSIHGRFGLTDTRNTTHGSGEAASCVHRIQREFGSRTLGRLGGGVERQVPQGAFLPVGFLALCGDLGRCGPGLSGGRTTGSEADYECFLRLHCTPYENPFSFSPLLTDSVVSASREIAAFFPDFSEQRWYEQEEPQLRCGPVHYSPEGGIHFAAPTGGPGPA